MQRCSSTKITARHKSPARWSATARRSSPAQNVAEHVKIDPSGNAKGTIDVTATHPVSLERLRNHLERPRHDPGHSERRRSPTSRRIVVSATAVLPEYQPNDDDHVEHDDDRERPRRQDAEPTDLSVDREVQLRRRIGKHGDADRRHLANQERKRPRSDAAQRLLVVCSKTPCTRRDTLNFTASGFSPSGGKSRQQYKSLNVDGACWNKDITSLNYVLTGTMKDLALLIPISGLAGGYGGQTIRVSQLRFSPLH